VDDCCAVPTAYAYELRSGEEILATGRMLADDELARGDEVTLAGIVARVEALAWANGEPGLILAPA
jgi:hypothetical protein